MTSNRNTKGFATKLQDLEALVTQLEDPNTPLEQSLEDFEKGIKLIREAQQALRAAELRVQTLLEQEGKPVTEPFEEGEDDQ
ncbi:MAG: exodeoxyribonuclease VII small subunit [Haliea sp.]|nr:exodeoxyribonuclease VII small subunit [Haliea sp.]|tara:strand:- start:602 stop:847 length:246 start_codon:yes stop_codon:yes gene_type:complete